MTIIQIEPLETGQHPIQSQSGRNSRWLEGWIEVPSNLEAKVWNTLGFCNLTIENGKLTDVIPTENPEIKNDRFLEIQDLKSKLSSTDYEAIKYAEGWMTETEYAPIKAQRQAWRDRINELEAEINEGSLG